jgi:hypothetical protein
MNRAQLEQRISTTESRLLASKLKDHARVNNMGWGYGMRCVKMPSFNRTDRIQERLDELKRQLKALDDVPATGITRR